MRQMAHWAALRSAAKAHRCSICRRVDRSRGVALAYCSEHDPDTGKSIEDPDTGEKYSWLPSGVVLVPSTGELLDGESGCVVGDTQRCRGCRAARMVSASAVRGCVGQVHRGNGRRSHPVIVSRGHGGRGGWSPTGLTRAMLRQKRLAWAMENFGHLSAEESAALSLMRADDAVAWREVLEQYMMHGSADPVP